MGATKVEFNAVGSGVLGIFYDLMPFCPALYHEGGYHGMMGKAFFYFLNFPQVIGKGPVGYEFNVVEAHHPGIPVIH
jgi:hypothetical protein